MIQYIFLATSLPALQIGAPPEINWEEFENLLKNNLLPGDYAQTVVLRRYYDILNMRSFWRGEPIDPHGNLDENDLEEKLIDREGFPKYISEYLDKYESKDDRIYHFPELMSAYFREEVRHASSFLQEYLDFERKLRLVMVAFRAQQLKRDVAKELQFENPDENFIAQILAQKDASTFEPPEEFEDLKPILQQHYNSPLELQKSLNEYRFAKIEDMLGVEIFTFRRILGYMAELIIVEKWLELDRTKGLEIVENILKGSS